MSPAVFAAAFVLVAAVAGAYALGRRQRERSAFIALVVSPLAAACAYVTVVGLAPDPAAASAAPPLAAPGQVAATAATPAATPAAGATSVAPVATVAMSRAGAGPVVEALRREAEELRSARKFSAARDAYARLAKATPQDADAWADLADASAAAAGGDLKAGAAAIDRALAVDPDHLKALWLKASLELQEKHYRTAIDLWQRLLARLPAESSDARIVNANLEETRSLAAREGAGR